MTTDGTDGIKFEEVFRVRRPTLEEVASAEADFRQKVGADLGSSAVGITAFLSVEGVRKVSDDIIAATALCMADDLGIPIEAAHTAVLGGFVGAIELFAALRLRTED